MTDVTAVPEGQISAELSAFVRTPFGTQCVRIGLAAFVSAVAAWTICAVLPKPAASSAPPPSHKTGRTAPAGQVGGHIDVAKVWAEERAQLHAMTNPGMRGARADAWSPAGGVSTLLATRFPSAGNVRTETVTVVPMPLPAPVARLSDGKRPAVDRKAPAKPAMQLASLPPQTPQTPEPGYFDFFRKLFANPDHAARAMLDANPKTAIYDIERRVVYLPGGEKLEAHSGYGEFMDDPTSFDRKNLGVTPPNVYAVSFREKLFHGVRALRMTPVGKGKMYGRDGILAHSYLLGEGGQSNGCMSVKDYDKFLQAYEDGKFKQIIVMRRIDGSTPPAQVASVQPGNS